MSSILGPAAVGGYRAIETAFAPTSLIGPALGNPGLPMMRTLVERRSHNSWALALKISLLSAALAIAYIVPVVFGRNLVIRIFGTGFKGYESLILPIAIGAIVGALGTGFTLLLIAARKMRETAPDRPAERGSDPRARPAARRVLGSRSCRLGRDDRRRPAAPRDHRGRASHRPRLGRTGPPARDGRARERRALRRLDVATAMRVLLLHSQYLSGAASGENRVVEDELGLLRDAGHDVAVVRPSVAVGSSSVRRATDSVWSASAVREVRRQVARISSRGRARAQPLPTPVSRCPARAAARAAVVMTLHNFRLMCLPATYLRDGAVCEDCAGRTPWRGVKHACYRDSRAASAALALSLVVHRSLKTFSRIDRFLAVSEFVRGKYVEAGIAAGARYGQAELHVALGTPHRVRRACPLPRPCDARKGSRHGSAGTSGRARARGGGRRARATRASSSRQARTSPSSAALPRRRPRSSYARRVRSWCRHAGTRRSRVSFSRPSRPEFRCWPPGSGPCPSSSTTASTAGSPRSTIPRPGVRCSASLPTTQCRPVSESRPSRPGNGASPRSWAGGSLRRPTRRRSARRRAARRASWST